jgi:uncharacterized protein (TIGR00299 family) protein
MNYLYFDAFSGASGDMILGALLDLGVDQSWFLTEMESLQLPVELSIAEVKRSSLRALKVTVEVKQEKPQTRKWADIARLVDGCPFSKSAKDRSLQIFRSLFEAEARVHGRAFEEVHLHEAGADDALIDILGFCVLSEHLDIDRFYSSPLNVGEGWVKTSHGTLPVPPPAVAELLKDFPVYSAWAKSELVTPTGAAIISTQAKSCPTFPELCYQKVGWGAGGRDIPDFPNILRVFFGKDQDFKPEKQVFQIEANIDDSNPQVLAGFMDTALSKGALDIYFTPISMKKNRQATKLSLLADVSHLDALLDSLFRETSTIGVRYFPVSRRILKREFITVQVMGEPVKLKRALLGEEEVNLQPEYDDCRIIADMKSIPVKTVMAMALKAYADEHMEKGRKNG